MPICAGLKAPVAGSENAAVAAATTSSDGPVGGDHAACRSPRRSMAWAAATVTGRFGSSAPARAWDAAATPPASSLT